LIPEVVKRGELEIGRFEVTRVQFAEFDKNYKFDAGTENYPASGITFDQAKNYVAWLSRTTGQTGYGEKPISRPGSIGEGVFN